MTKQVRRKWGVGSNGDLLLYNLKYEEAIKIVEDNPDFYLAKVQVHTIPEIKTKTPTLTWEECVGYEYSDYYKRSVFGRRVSSSV